MVGILNHKDGQRECRPSTSAFCPTSERTLLDRHCGSEDDRREKKTAEEEEEVAVDDVPFLPSLVIFRSGNRARARSLGRLVARSTVAVGRAFAGFTSVT